MKKLLFLLLFFAGTYLHAQLAIIAFEAKQLNKQVKLQWTVGRGNTCQDIEVQHSHDGQNFTTIYTYLGICGEATFDQTYSWTQENPVLNTDNYYRLNTSTGVISDTVMLRVIGYNESGILISPNPAQSATTIFFYNPGNQSHRLELFNAEGKILWQSEKSTGNKIEISRPENIAGLCFFRLIPDEGEIISGSIQFH